MGAQPRVWTRRKSEGRIHPWMDAQIREKLSSGEITPDHGSRCRASGTHGLRSEHADDIGPIGDCSTAERSNVEPVELTLRQHLVRVTSHLGRNHLAAHHARFLDGVEKRPDLRSKPIVGMLVYRLL